MAAIILIGANRLTLPNTNARRIASAQADLMVAEIAIKREQQQIFMDGLIEKRIQGALPSGDDA